MIHDWWVIIIKDEYVVTHLYVPIIMIFLLMLMIYFHRRHVLRYLYSINILLYFVSIICYFILINHVLGKNLPAQWMSDIPFIWLIGICGGNFLSFISINAFITENSRKYVWAKIVLGIARIVFIILCIFGIYFFIEGVLSLKSG